MVYDPRGPVGIAYRRSTQIMAHRVVGQSATATDATAAARVDARLQPDSVVLKSRPASGKGNAAYSALLAAAGAAQPAAARKARELDEDSDIEEEEELTMRRPLPSPPSTTDYELPPPPPPLLPPSVPRTALAPPATTIEEAEAEWAAVPTMKPHVASTDSGAAAAAHVLPVPPPSRPTPPPSRPTPPLGRPMSRPSSLPLSRPTVPTATDAAGESAFVAASSFTGARGGYVFKMGKLGLGYYRETAAALEPSSTATVTVAAAAPGTPATRAMPGMQVARPTAESGTAAASQPLSAPPPPPPPPRAPLPPAPPVVTMPTPAQPPSQLPTATAPKTAPSTGVQTAAQGAVLRSGAPATVEFGSMRVAKEDSSSEEEDEEDEEGADKAVGSGTGARVGAGGAGAVARRPYQDDSDGEVEFG